MVLMGIDISYYRKKIGHKRDIWGAWEYLSHEEGKGMKDYYYFCIR